MLPSSVNVLLADDDDVDVMGLKRACNKLGLTNPLHVAGDGIEALEMLRGENGHAAIPKPHLILLDLNMPRMNGIEFLQEMRQDPELGQTLVFVLTTSNADEDRFKAYQSHISGYMVKSNTERTFFDALEMIDKFCRIVEFP